MNRLPGLILLQDQNTRAFRIVSVVFHYHGGRQALDDVADQHVVCSELLVPMRGDTHLASCH